MPRHGAAELTRRYADDWTWLWYYDSAGAVQTQGLNIWAHTADFVLILMLLRRFNLSQWGFPREANSKAKLTAVWDGMPQPESSTGPGSATGTASATSTPLTGFDMSAVGIKYQFGVSHSITKERKITCVL